MIRSLHMEIHIDRDVNIYWQNRLKITVKSDLGPDQAVELVLSPDALDNVSLLDFMLDKATSIIKDYRSKNE